MKKIKEWKRFGKVFEGVEDDIIELEDVCAWMSDRVDSVEIRSNGIVNGESRYNIDISYRRQEDQDLSRIVQNAEEMNELTKEYAELILRLGAMGYEVSYHLLETKQHKNFYSFIGKINLGKNIAQAGWTDI
jgi:hypothetical protein